MNSTISNKKRKRKSTKKNDFMKTFDITQKKAKKTLSKLDKANLQMIRFNKKNVMNVVVNSETSDSKYNVSIILNPNGLSLECDCGKKFGIGPRKNCKHISTVIYSQIANYIDSIHDTKSCKIMNKLEDLFKSFNL